MDQTVPHPIEGAPRSGAAAPVRSGTRARLGGLLAGAILLPALILAVAAFGAWRSTSLEADRELAVAAEAATEYALRMIEGHARIAARIAESLAGNGDDEIRDAAAALRERLAQFIDDLPLVTGVLLTGADGEVLVHAARRARAGAGVPDLAAARLASAGPEVQLGGPLLPAPGQAPVFVLARPRLEGRGVVALLLDANEMGAGLRRVLGAGGDSAALVRADGQILARHPPFVAPPPPLGADKPLIAALAAGQSQGRVDGETPRDGRAVLVRFRTLDRHPGIAVAAARPWSEIAARWRAAMLPLLLIGLPAIAALVALAWLVRRKQHALEDTLALLEQRVADRTASLREQEERLRLAVGAARAGTWEMELDTGRTIRSALARQILGLPEGGEDSDARDWRDRIHPLDRPAADRAMHEMASGRLPEYAFQYRFQRPDGAWRWLDSAAAVVRTDPATGVPLLIAGIVQDITERREAEERRDLLTQEVNHRARNTLAIVQAILRLTRAEDAATYARLIEGRIAALARAQSLLAAERWTGAPFGTLVAEELAPFGGTGEGASARFLLEGPPLRLRAQAVQPLGMVFHELATNAAKHGALSVPGGQVAVTWSTDEAAGLLRIRWTETGGPAPSFPQRRGVGSRVIEATAGGQLGGSVERRWPASGLVCDIALPLAATRAGPV